MTQTSATILRRANRFRNSRRTETKIKLFAPVTTPAPVAVAPVSTAKRRKHIDQTVHDAVMSLPYAEGMFRFITCSRVKATKIQQWLYWLNKHNVNSTVYATRYDARQGQLLVWRMG